mmetsp:Transcript_48715/g.155710  ORF Transcript_48715/g.155710 Transcript_48715/m.155710 type:complete len:228 (+) Transcript_48715:718-1401(+)
MATAEVRPAAQGLQQRGVVAPKHFTCLGRHCRGVVGLSHDGDTTWGDLDPVLLRSCAIAACRRGKVDDNRAVSHALKHLFRDQHRRCAVWDHCGRDHDIHFGDNARVGCELCLFVGLPQVRCVAASALARYACCADWHKLGAHALHLLTSRLTHVIRIDLGAQGVRRCNGAQAGHTHTNNEDLRGRYSAASSDGRPAESWKAVEGVNHGTVAGNVGHRRKRIQLLCP